jgi:hypothetical protein
MIGTTRKELRDRSKKAIPQLLLLFLRPFGPLPEDLQSGILLEPPRRSSYQLPE